MSTVAIVLSSQTTGEPRNDGCFENLTDVFRSEAMQRAIQPSSNMVGG